MNNKYHKFWVNLSTNTEQYSGSQQETFQGGGGLVELRHFDKRFVKNTRK